MGELIPECTVPYISRKTGEASLPHPLSHFLFSPSPSLGRCRNRRTWNPRAPRPSPTMALIYHTAVGNNFSPNFSAPVDARLLPLFPRISVPIGTRAGPRFFSLSLSLACARIRVELSLRFPGDTRSNLNGERENLAPRHHVIMYSRLRCANREFDPRGGVGGRGG